MLKSYVVSIKTNYVFKKLDINCVIVKIIAFLLFNGEVSDKQQESLNMLEMTRSCCFCLDNF